MSKQRRKPRRPPEAPSGAHLRRWRWWTAGIVAGFALVTGLATIYRGPLLGLLGGAPPNVLLITVDTTRADYLGCYGRPGNRTPNMDRLAREGTLFTRCTTCSPLTFPSHASILTSLYPYAHGVRHNGTGRLAESNRTLAEVLRAAGFHTQATVASFVLDRKFGTDQGFEVYHDVAASETGDELHAERRGDVVCDDALQMLRSLAKERFFLWVHFYDAHYPYVSPRNTDRESAAAYEDEVSFVDTQIGRLLDSLAQLGLDRRTLIVLVADHGEGLGEHGERLHGDFLYDSTLHTPLIMRGPPAIPLGRKVAAQVRTIDVAPTILALLGLPVWDQAQGVSLTPLLSGQAEDLHLAAYSESLEGEAAFRLSVLRSLSVGGWKYVLAPRPELYDLGADPGETRNLADEQPARVAALREQVHDLLAAAPPPPAPEDRVVAMSVADRSTLESLGYLGIAAEEEEASQSELDRFEPRGGDPKDYVRWFELKARAGGALRDKNYARAEQMLRALVKAVPDVPGLRLDLGRALREQGRLPEADAEYRHAVSLAPGDASAHQTYGRFLLFSAQRFADAGQQFELALAEEPDNVNLLHDYAVALMGLGQLDRAEQYLQQALDLEPEDARLTQALGVLRMRQNRFAEAAECFRRTLALDPDCGEAKAALQWLSRGQAPRRR
jgi:arylsulfatase A-like enzyme/Tfp pilus assembly protein PilF